MKKTITFLLAVLILSVSIFSLSSCTEDSNSDANDDNKSSSSSKDKTTTSDTSITDTTSSDSTTDTAFDTTPDTTADTTADTSADTNDDASSSTPDNTDKDRSELTPMECIDLFVAGVNAREKFTYKKYLYSVQRQELESSSYVTLSSIFECNGDLGDYLKGYSSVSPFEKKEVKAEFKKDNQAVCYIEYTYPTSRSMVVEIRLAKETDGWGIVRMAKVSENADFEQLAFAYNFNIISEFADNVAYVEYIDFYGDKKYGYIDTDGNLLFEVAGFEARPDYVGGICVYKDKVYDKSGKIIASSETHGYDKLVSDNLNGRVLAIKRIEAFPNDEYHIGIINNKGEWEYPMSADHPIVKAIGKNDNYLYQNLYLSYKNRVSENYIHINTDYGYYNFINNKVTPSYYHYEYSNGDIVLMDESGSTTSIIPGVTHDFWTFDSFCIVERYKYVDGNSIYSYDVLDYSNNLLFALPDAGYAPDFIYTNGVLLFSRDNINNVPYLFLMSLSGQKLMDPIRLEGCSYIVGDTGFIVQKDGFYSFYDYSGNLLAKHEKNDDLDYIYGFSCGRILARTSDNRQFYLDINGDIVII